MKKLATIVMAGVLLYGCAKSPEKYDVEESVYNIKETRNYVIHGRPDRLNDDKFYLRMDCGDSDILVKLNHTVSFGIVIGYDLTQVKKALFDEIMDGDDQKVIVEGKYDDGILTAESLTVDDTKYHFPQ